MTKFTFFTGLKSDQKWLQKWNFVNGLKPLRERSIYTVSRDIWLILERSLPGLFMARMLLQQFQEAKVVTGVWNFSKVLVMVTVLVLYELGRYAVFVSLVATALFYVISR